MISINGINISGGRNVVISGNRVIVDGKDVTPGDEKNISIEVVGDIDYIEADYCQRINVKGRVSGNIRTISGDVVVQEGIGGGINTTSGDVEVNGNSGAISTTSGDVECGTVNGNIRTVSGDVSHN